MVARHPLVRGRLAANASALFATWLLAAAFSAPSMAATYTWTNAAMGFSLWSEGGNWSPNMPNDPVGPLDLVFPNGGGYGQNDLRTGTILRTMDFTSTANFHGFDNSDPSNVAANTMDIAAGGLITNASANIQYVYFRLNLVNDLEANVTGTGPLILANFSGARDLNKTGTGTLNLSGNFFDSGYTMFTGNVNVAAGTVYLGQPTLPAITNMPNSTITSAEGTTLSGGSVFAKKIVAGGVVETGWYEDANYNLMIDALSTSDLKLLSTSTTLFDINAAQPSSPPNLSNTQVLLTSTSGSASLDYGGQVSVEFTDESVYEVSNQWDLFKADPGTTVDRTGGLAGLSTAGVGPYAGLTFTKIDPGTGSGDAIWLSDWARSTGTKLMFNESTGQLVVVPEPSTMVFAGIGVMMSGWSLVCRQRRANAARRAAATLPLAV
jgi:hypothetical protein